MFIWERIALLPCFYIQRRVFKLIIIIIIVFVGIPLVYSLCVVASRSDKAMDDYFNASDGANRKDIDKDS